MRGFLIRTLISAFGLWIAAKLVPSMHFDGPGTLLLAAVLLGVVNAVVHPVFLLLTLPITVVTLGLVAALLDGFALGGKPAVGRRAARRSRAKTGEDDPGRYGAGLAGTARISVPRSSAAWDAAVSKACAA